jgi:hypothetical protein
MANPIELMELTRNRGFPIGHKIPCNGINGKYAAAQGRFYRSFTHFWGIFDNSAVLMERGMDRHCHQRD